MGIEMGGYMATGEIHTLGQYAETLDTLMMRIQSERALMLDDQVRDQAQKIERKNDLLKQANMMLIDARLKKNEAGKGTSTMSAAMVAFYEQNGIQYDTKGNDYKHKKEEWDINIANLETFVDTLTSNSQLDMTRLQSIMGKYNQTFEMLSNFVKKYQSSVDSVTRNLGA
jgi:hypothetical protein